MNNEGVIVGLSGGVDSASAAWLLHGAGYRVTGVTLRFYCSARANRSPRPCCSDELLRGARRLCAKLGLQHRVIDVEEEFRELVVKDFIGEYRAGRTPNPCVVCNEKVKFPALARVADWLGCERIATGHYARLVRGAHGAPFIAAARDAAKDQSYFLYRVPVRILDRTLFPLGDALKASVKGEASGLGLASARTRESQDVCFLPDGDLGRFLRDEIGSAPGDVVDRSGRTLGRHEGAHFYTIGQRKGLGIAAKHALYVSAIDAGARRIVLGPREDIYSARATIGRLRMRSRDLGGVLHARIRYRKAPAEVARIERRGREIAVSFREPQWGVTPGQSLVLYRGDVVIGGGIIDRGA
ncbi:MAG TPA: tRNA 2-thiouridine(34) synthase MnmA [Candidatus Bathyarchaeia archaeon]|nr:tRNA 2-thiouridine(34) synthase MnmA [Candidatus Bathyarchaeia archaeon]